MIERMIFLAYDHGLEHGPDDFNEINCDPAYIIEIAKKGKFDGVILQKGIAFKYYKELKKARIPLILKLNGKTNLYKGEPISRRICSVEEALKLNASYIGYTIYIGSRYESVMMKEFSEIEKEARENNLKVIAWIYPRGKSVENIDEDKLMIYSARVGMELNADMIKIRYSGSKEALKRAVKIAGRTRILLAGGMKRDEKQFLNQIAEIKDVDFNGLAVGRNVWQSKEPLKLARRLREILAD